MQDPRLIAVLRQDLLAAGYDVDGVTDLLGPMAARALEREQTVPALRATEPAELALGGRATEPAELALGGRATEPAELAPGGRATERAEPAQEPIGVLTRLWTLGAPVTRRELDRALPRTGVDGAIALELAEAAGAGPQDAVRPLVDLRPHGDSERSWWLASDLAELVTHSPLYPDHVLGVGGASATLARWTPRPKVERALDLGTGCGVQTFHLAGHCGSVTATDVSKRALRFARFNLALNDVSADLRQGDVFAPVAGERFDLVVSNPPFVITPRDGQVPEYAYRDAGLAGDAIVRRLVREVGTVLAPGGIAQFLGNWEFAGDWTERVGSWLDESGLDGWILQREVQDPAEYAEVWLADGGHHQGSPGYERMYRAWLDDFAVRGVEGIGFGIITLRASDRGLRRIEEVTGELGEPMGQAVLDVLQAHDWLADRTDEALLAERLVVPADVTEERYGRPGAEDPEVIQLRQGGGLRRVVRADTALAGCVGACTGELELGRIIAALGVLLEEETAALRSRLVPAVRALISDGLLKPIDTA